MSFRTTFNTIIEPFGYTIQAKTKEIYDQDGLRSIHNHDFMTDPSFLKAYQRGTVAAGNHENGGGAPDLAGIATQARPLGPRIPSMIDAGDPKGMLSAATRAGHFKR